MKNTPHNYAIDYVKLEELGRNPSSIGKISDNDKICTFSRLSGIKGELKRCVRKRTRGTRAPFYLYIYQSH